jgi:hypothetical protein
VQGRRAFKLDGLFFGGYRGVDGPTAGGVATAWVLESLFVRFGGESTPRSAYGTSRFLWGFGYDDWRGNTLYAHVDNWGPIRPQDGFTSTRTAEVNVGYKLPRLCAARWMCFAPMAGVTAPFVGGPYANARVTLNVGQGWFVMGGLGRTIPGVLPGPFGTPDWRVVYGFGYSSWKSPSLYVTYFDWGPTSRSGNGILSLGIYWAL